MDVAGRAMSKLHGAKVLHVLRDPRAILMSRRRHGYLDNFASYNEASKSLCDYMMQNIRECKKWQAKFPGLIKTVLFEDIAENPVGGAKHIYEFLGLQFNDVIKSGVMEMTHAPNGVLFKESSVYSWRRTLNFTDVQAIDYNCQDVYDVMGLRTFDTKNLMRDMSTSSRIKEYNVGEYLLEL